MPLPKAARTTIELSRKLSDAIEGLTRQEDLMWVHGYLTGAIERLEARIDREAGKSESGKGESGNGKGEGRGDAEGASAGRSALPEASPV